jgi:hypothetical protein
MNFVGNAEDHHDGRTGRDGASAVAGRKSPVFPDA